MRVGFIGAIANNMYLMARATRDAGIDSIYVHDVDDTFPVSQPSWQHERVLLALSDMSRVTDLDSQPHSRWVAPDWVITPSEGTDFKPRGLTRGSLLAVNAMASRHRWWGSALDHLTSTDLIVACGANATVLAWASGVPFLIWPHGADARLAASLEGASDGRFIQNLRTRSVAKLLRIAYREALGIATQDPKLLGGVQGDLSARLKAKRVMWLPWPAQTLSVVPSTSAGPAELAEFLETELPLLVVPSRVDFRVKGHEMLFRGFACLEPDSAQMIVTGWGRDLSEAQSLVESLGISRNVTFLPFLLSKPVLYELFERATLVADQFRLSTYGAAAVEAMGLRRPVLMNIDADAYLGRGWEPPPVLQAATESEIAEQLSLSFSRDSNLETQQRAAFSWVSKNHSPEAVAGAIDAAGRLI